MSKSLCVCAGDVLRCVTDVLEFLFHPQSAAAAASDCSIRPVTPGGGPTRHTAT